jgi:hypothetical protein
MSIGADVVDGTKPPKVYMANVWENLPGPAFEAAVLHGTLSRDKVTVGRCKGNYVMQMAFVKIFHEK